MKKNSGQKLLRFLIRSILKYKVFFLFLFINDYQNKKDEIISKRRNRKDSLDASL